MNDTTQEQFETFTLPEEPESVAEYAERVDAELAEIVPEVFAPHRKERPCGCVEGVGRMVEWCPAHEPVVGHDEPVDALQKDVERIASFALTGDEKYTAKHQAPETELPLLTTQGSDSSTPPEAPASQPEAAPNTNAASAISSGENSPVEAPGLLTPDEVERAKTGYRNALATRAAMEDALAPARAELEAKRAEIERQYQEANAEALHSLGCALETAAAEEERLRTHAIAYYDATGEKTYDENIGVRVNTALEYSMDEAVDWAEKNAPVAVKRTVTVDKKAFEALASTADLDFVTTRETVTATLRGLK